MKANLLVWVLYALLIVYADDTFTEVCPTVSGSANFNVTQYVGRWYLLSVTPHFSRYSVTRCAWLNEELLPNGNLKTEKTSIKANTNERSGVTSETAIVQNKTGEWSVAYRSTPQPTDDPNAFVLDTDNTEFSYLWACWNHIPYLWILNRDYNRTVDYIEQQEQNAFDILQGFGYSNVSVTKLRNYMEIEEHVNCDY